MQQVKRYEYPNKDYVINTIQIRIDRLKLLDDWCVKVMRYHGLQQHHLEQLFDISDKIIKLQRKNKVDQAISQYLATYNNSWHNAQGEAQSIDYSLYKGIVKGVIREDLWISAFDQFTSEYYENLDLSDSIWKKNKVKVDYDRQICSNIVNTFLDNLRDRVGLDGWPPGIHGATLTDFKIPLDQLPEDTQQMIANHPLSWTPQRIANMTPEDFANQAFDRFERFNDVDFENGTFDECGTRDAPTDALIVHYIHNDRDCYDLTRGNRSKIFDMYYDKFKTGLKSINYGGGNIKPSMWGYQSSTPPKTKKRK